MVEAVAVRRPDRIRRRGHPHHRRRGLGWDLDRAARKHRSAEIHLDDVERLECHDDLERRDAGLRRDHELRHDDHHKTRSDRFNTCDLYKPPEHDDYHDCPDRTRVLCLGRHDERKQRR